MHDDALGERGLRNTININIIIINIIIDWLGKWLCTV